MSDWFEFEVVQGGMVVAGAGCPDREAALREAEHYAMVYAQDGPCEIQEVFDDGSTVIMGQVTFSKVKIEP